MSVTIIGRTESPSRCALRWSEMPLRNSGSPKMPRIAVPIKMVPAMSQRSASRCAWRLSSSWSSRPAEPATGGEAVTMPGLPVPLRPHAQLDGEHEREVAVDDDLEKDEGPLLLAVLLVHVVVPF